MAEPAGRRLVQVARLAAAGFIFSTDYVLIIGLVGCVAGLLLLLIPAMAGLWGICIVASAG